MNSARTNQEHPELGPRQVEQPVSEENRDNPDLKDINDRYEVKRSRRRHDDSYIGSLDILTVHEQIGEQPPADAKTE